MTTWDLAQAGRAFVFATLGVMVAWLVTAMSDEGGMSWGTRLTRVLPVVPACAAWGTWLAQVRGWARGEGRAQAALGRAPLASSAGAVIGGAMVAWCFALGLVVLRPLDASGFFPRARGEPAYVVASGGEFENPATGRRIHADGSFAPRAEPAPRRRAASPIPSHGRLVAALTTALFGLALCLVVAKTHGGSRLETGCAVALSVGASLVLFQGAAAGRLAALWAVVPSLALGTWAALRANGRAQHRSLIAS
jgi:hypothetical protein